MITAPAMTKEKNQSIFVFFSLRKKEKKNDENNRLHTSKESLTDTLTEIFCLISGLGFTLWARAFWGQDAY
jgi:hypothetical protein